MIEPLDVEPMTIALASVIGAHLIGIMGSLHAVMTARTPQGAIAFTDSFQRFGEAGSALA